MKKKPHNLVIGIYFHPEAYPPTLNAVEELSACFDHITIVHRPHLRSSWQYPANVETVATGNPVSAKQQEAASVPKKMAFFAGFVRFFFKECLRAKPAVILVYDTISLYAYHLIRKILPFRHSVWYHSHDVVERSLLRKFSIGWLAARTEPIAFRYLNIFSLPAQDRLQYFPMHKFTGRYFFIPNYPSKKVYALYKAPADLSSFVNLIFQGSMDNTHGIEEILPVLKESIAGKELALKLLGKSIPGYKESIEALAASYHVSNRVHFEGLQPYKNIPTISSLCHIGLAIYTKPDVMNTTIGTASNKIYEYAAVGLPVLCYDNEYYREQLGKYSWVFYTDCSIGSYQTAIRNIIHRYPELSMAARKDFINHLNFETGFREVKAYINQR